MDVAKIKATAAQSIPTGVLTTITNMTTEVYEQGTTVVADTTSSVIQLTEAGFYLVTFDATVIGDGQHLLYLLGNGFAPTGTEVLEFFGTANGVVHGRVLIMRADSRAFLRLAAQHNGGANRDYTCTLCVAKLAVA